MVMTEREARAIVRARSNGVCEGCRRARATDWSHRVSRAQGGPWTPSNGLDLCHPDHMWLHLNPAAAGELGWYLKSWQDPLTVPAVVGGLRVLLDDEGQYRTPVTA